MTSAFIYWKRHRCVDQYAISNMGKKFMGSVWFDPIEIIIMVPTGIFKITEAMGIEV